MIYSGKFTMHGSRENRKTLRKVESGNEEKLNVEIGFGNKL